MYNFFTQLFFDAGTTGRSYRPLGGQSGKGGDVSTKHNSYLEHHFDITFPIIGKTLAYLQTCSVPLRQRLKLTVKLRPS